MTTYSTAVGVQGAGFALAYFVTAQNTADLALGDAHIGY